MGDLEFFGGERGWEGPTEAPAYDAPPVALFRAWTHLPFDELLKPLHAQDCMQDTLDPGSSTVPGMEERHMGGSSEERLGNKEM